MTGDITTAGPRARRRVVAATLVAMTLTACGSTGMPGVLRGDTGLNVIDESNLSEIMLSAGDPSSAVLHFRRLVAEDPERIDALRGLAISLTRASRPAAAAEAWRAVAVHEEATHKDGVSYAGALIRVSDFDTASRAIRAVPPTYESFDRYRIEAILADSQEDWERADAFYETALRLTDEPAGVLNNWGYSKLARGDAEGAERLFLRAIGEAPELFTAKNNLALARGAQRRYEIPLIDIDQEERARLLHTLGLSAVKQGDVATGKALLRDAVASHPRHFGEAARALAALEDGGTL